jgi:hypothetical protein
MLSDLLASNQKAAAMVVDPSPHISAICPRRAGKTYAAVLAALITGEAAPDRITLIISLNLKQLRRLYWAGGPSGITTLARRYGIKLECNDTSLRWEHENGSIGYLLGADNAEQIEAIRGLEADLYIIDECKSFAPGVLRLLIDDIIDPQRASRKGRLMLIGTPGFIFQGPFYEATCPTAKDENGRPYLIGINARYEPNDRTADAWGRTAAADLLWSCHHWTLEDNLAMPHQWADAQVKKRAKKWADTNPQWCREYLGHWAEGGFGLVFRYHIAKLTGGCTWQPLRTIDNPAGLPEEGAPWRLVGGLDLGYEAPTAFVIAAYSQRLRQIRVIHDESHVHLLPPDIAAMIRAAVDKYGPIERIFCDAGNLGVTIVETLIREGLPCEKVDKREKYDYIELVNAAFEAGELLIVDNTAVEHQLLTVAWKIPDVPEPEKEAKELARRGKLREDDAIPNDSTDALIYLYRGSLHHFGVPKKTDEPTQGTPEWVRAWERKQLAAARAEFKQQPGYRRPDQRMARAPSAVRRALTSKWSPPSSFPRT